ncbi:unnamed protein product [Polarella glacialis]|uniref:tRNA/rRNA methyltransferase SpoU type domain-containing protein n=1 Tax=Polarella glacialis TaxID=89957 RepID=A0A813K620_POLGL|nr:unnamed protein product [Polarella glacialis]
MSTDGEFSIATAPWCCSKVEAKAREAELEAEAERRAQHRAPGRMKPSLSGAGAARAVGQSVTQLRLVASGSDISSTGATGRAESSIPRFVRLQAELYEALTGRCMCLVRAAQAVASKDADLEQQARIFCLMRGCCVRLRRSVRSAAEVPLTFGWKGALARTCKTYSHPWWRIKPEPTPEVSLTIIGDIAAQEAIRTDECIMRTNHQPSTGFDILLSSLPTGVRCFAQLTADRGPTQDRGPTGGDISGSPFLCFLFQVKSFEERGSALNIDCCASARDGSADAKSTEDPLKPAPSSWLSGTSFVNRSSQLHTFNRPVGSHTEVEALHMCKFKSGLDSETRISDSFVIAVLTATSNVTSDGTDVAWLAQLVDAEFSDGSFQLLLAPPDAPALAIPCTSEDAPSETLVLSDWAAHGSPCRVASASMSLLSCRVHEGSKSVDTERNGRNLRYESRYSGLFRRADFGIAQLSLMGTEGSTCRLSPAIDDLSYVFVRLLRPPAAWQQLASSVFRAMGSSPELVRKTSIVFLVRKLVAKLTCVPVSCSPADAIRTCMVYEASCSCKWNPVRHSRPLGNPTPAVALKFFCGAAQSPAPGISQRLSKQIIQMRVQQLDLASLKFWRAQKLCFKSRATYSIKLPARDDVAAMLRKHPAAICSSSVDRVCKCLPSEVEALRWSVSLVLRLRHPLVQSVFRTAQPDILILLWQEEGILSQCLCTQAAQVGSDSQAAAFSQSSAWLRPESRSWGEALEEVLAAGGQLLPWESGKAADNSSWADHPEVGWNATSIGWSRSESIPFASCRASVLLLLPAERKASDGASATAAARPLGRRKAVPDTPCLGGQLASFFTEETRLFRRPLAGGSEKRASPPLPSQADFMGLKKGLRPGPAEFCKSAGALPQQCPSSSSSSLAGACRTICHSQALLCDPAFLTPLAACSPDSGVVKCVLVSAELSTSSSFRKEEGILDGEQATYSFFSCVFLLPMGHVCAAIGGSEDCTSINGLQVALRMQENTILLCPLEALLSAVRCRCDNVANLFNWQGQGSLRITLLSGGSTSRRLLATFFAQNVISDLSHSEALKPSRPAPSPALADALAGYQGKVQWIDDYSDALLDDFRDLKGLSSETACIIVEGPETIRMALASDFTVDRLLLKPSLFVSMRESLDIRAERVRRDDGVEEDVLVLLCEASLMERVTGVPAKHASAALASARRRANAPSLRQLLLLRGEAETATLSPLRLLALDAGLDEEAVGALFRVAAAFGVSAVLLADGCGDAFHRRAVRVSMGHVFRVPCIRGDLAEFLHELRGQSVLTLAASEGSARDVQFLDEISNLPSRWVCTVGPDGPVSSREVRDACELQVAVRTALPCPIGAGVVASVLLYGCVEREGKCLCTASGDVAVGQSDT